MSQNFKDEDIKACNIYCLMCNEPLRICNIFGFNFRYVVKQYECEECKTQYQFQRNGIDVFIGKEWANELDKAWNIELKNKIMEK